MTSYFQIPLQPGRSQNLRVTLQGVVYTLSFSWNDVSNCWIMGILDETGTTKIISGIPLVTGTDLLGQYSYLPVAAQAVLLAITVGPSESPDTVPTLDNLGLDGRLIYVTP